ncbi:hypothetical protein, partial [Pseudomonas tremae]
MLIGHSLHHMRPTAVDSSLPTSATSQTISNTKSRLDPHRVRELTFIGVGSSVAYLLNELNGR